MRTIDADMCEPYFYEHLDDNAMAGAMNAINEMPTIEPERKWIPCKDGEPKEYGEYRITWTTSVSKKRFIGDAEYEVSDEWDAKQDRFKGEWILDDYIKNYPDVKVIAWKPLEEPYRG